MDLWNHPVVQATHYVTGYSAGHTSETEDMDYHAAEQLRFLADLTETEPAWLLHLARRNVERGLTVARERRNPYLETFGF